MSLGGLGLQGGVHKTMDGRSSIFHDAKKKKNLFSKPNLTKEWASH